MKGKWLLLTIVILGILLRVFRLSTDPPSLYWDEASLGYNAYSISQTLHDEHGEFLPVARFIAFGDYKAPGYIYADAAVIKFFGLSEFTVRFPSALAGILIIFGTFLLSGELLKLKEESFEGERNLVPLLSAFLIAISPWAIQFSRAAFEANLATCLELFSIYFLLRGLKGSKYLSFFIAGILSVASMYTFNSHRIFIPMIDAAIILIFWRKSLKSWKQIILFGIISVLLLAPQIPFLLSREGRLRFYEVTWLNDSAPVVTANARATADGDTALAKLIHNRRLEFSRDFLKHYFDNFRGDFLFSSGDVNPRLSMQSFGELYWIELPLLLAGIYFLAKYRSKASLLLLLWAILAPIPAATARETPHALRILNILPVLQIVVAFGLFYLLSLFKLRGKITTLIFVVTASLLYSGSFFAYFHDYLIHYPVRFADSWQYGYKQMADYVYKNSGKYDYVSITEKYGRPYIYMLFYGPVDPNIYWATKSEDRDWFGFWYVHGFGKYKFGDDIAGRGKWLIVRGPGDTPTGSQILKTIYDPQGEPVFEISQENK